jgi:hypothetical protein
MPYGGNYKATVGSTLHISKVNPHDLPYSLQQAAKDYNKKVEEKQATKQGKPGLTTPYRFASEPGGHSF